MTSVNPINGITSEEVKSRLRQVNDETPVVFWSTSVIKEPQDLTVRMVARNNIMLEKIMDNQNKIMQKLGIGQKLNTNA